LEVGDILYYDDLDYIMKKHRPMAVMHFAALSLVGESVLQPERYYTNNVIGSLNILKAMCSNNIEHIVFSSSCAVYGNPQQIPIPEGHPTLPVNAYGQTKLTVENMLFDFARARNFHYISLRYFNAAGADPDAKIGEYHNPETHLVPLVIKAAMGETRLEVFGTDYDTPDGTAIRDYIHVDDIADAHILALDTILNGGKNAVLNLGTGTGTSVREIISTMEAIIGRKIPVTDTPRREGDPPVLVAGPSRLLEIMGWKPVYTDIRKIMETAWKWHCSIDKVA
jgi:UDP-glucose-4-epimerase GalE